MVMDTSDCGDAEAWLAAYDDYLHRMLGAAKATRVRYLRTARRFVGACLGSASAPWAGLSVAQVTAFIQQETASKSGHGRAAPACAVRSFLRFLAWRGVGPGGLDRAIPPMRRARHASLPPRLAPAELVRLLDQPGDHPAAWRDRAILLLLGRLGLRAGEIVALGLDDIDWRAGLLRLPAGKSRRERVLPLSQEVGCALADYLWHGRPAHPSRRLFLTATKPPRGFNHTSAVTRIVQRSLRRAGIAVGRLTAAHMLRHTAASAMVNRGASFHQVADVLGHRSLATTGIYAKLDLDALAPVALPWSGGAQ